MHQKYTYTHVQKGLDSQGARSRRFGQRITMPLNTYRQHRITQQRSLSRTLKHETYDP